ncbi:expressed unknown protein [Seminavis robusta]|uniref:Uncharacterized protein n=1 Tax=Seminavis robusta TaxID=568900 RepID=A0A9N8HF17_9STRA|nr:expressed unknown protein [Seminavis robusta]|eukprot:Sro328_g118520.1 n/a (251) ;mRNA; f:1783-2535
MMILDKSIPLLFLLAATSLQVSANEWATFNVNPSGSNISSVDDLKAHLFAKEVGDEFDLDTVINEEMSALLTNAINADNAMNFTYRAWRNASEATSTGTAFLCKPLDCDIVILGMKACDIAADECAAAAAYNGQECASFYFLNPEIPFLQGAAADCSGISSEYPECRAQDDKVDEFSYLGTCTVWIANLMDTPTYSPVEEDVEEETASSTSSGESPAPTPAPGGTSSTSAADHLVLLVPLAASMICMCFL